jgi:hypothetical protein
MDMLLPRKVGCCRWSYLPVADAIAVNRSGAGSPHIDDDAVEYIPEVHVSFQVPTR